MRCVGLILLLALGPVSAGAAETPGQAAIASAHPLATEAGMEVLREGGNAFDAAIAVTAALGVVEPYSSGIGGGGFWLLHRASDGRQVVVDGREVAPGAARRDCTSMAPADRSRARRSTGRAPRPSRGSRPASRTSRRTMGGCPLSRTLAPAIGLARDGFRVSPRYREAAALRVKSCAPRRRRPRCS